jgi:hypothetical protein
MAVIDLIARVDPEPDGCQVQETDGRDDGQQGDQQVHRSTRFM